MVHSRAAKTNDSSQTREITESNREASLCAEPPVRRRRVVYKNHQHQWFSHEEYKSEGMRMASAEFSRPSSSVGPVSAGPENMRRAPPPLGQRRAAGPACRALDDRVGPCIQSPEQVYAAARRRSARRRYRNEDTGMRDIITGSAYGR
jgi:hypothetical protein